ncbi:MAG TPA: nuclear transport factor 2 family protein [Steroidobacteraceae bacterium]|nr:nuclear transport factor 2 family protein [Steroidobacteraceae bacterium]
MMTRLLTILIIASLAPIVAWAAPPAAAPADASASAERVVEARSRAWVKAALDGDADAFRTFATDDYVMLWVDPATEEHAARWATRTRDQWVDSIRSGKTKYQSVVLRNTKVHINGDVATFTGEYTQTGLEDGNESTESGFFVETWVRRRGQWLAVSSVFP